MPKTLADFYQSATATQCYLSERSAIAVKPVRVTTSKQERENQRDAGQAETTSHIEWLALYAADSGYTVSIWKHEGRIDEERFTLFDEAMNYFNHWQQP